MRIASALLALLFAFAPAPRLQAATAWTTEVQGLSYDEECMLYCLQGLANRTAPRLFLDTGAIFWTHAPSDRYWMEYLHRRKGFDFTRLSGLRQVVEHFRSTVRGLAVYDPARDASRYVALTLCAQRGLLPVTPAMLAYQTPALGASARWTEDDMRAPARWIPAAVRAEATSDGLRISPSSPTQPFGAADRSVQIDVARAPILEVTVASCTGAWAVKLGEGGAVDTMVLPESGRTGVIRQDLRGVARTTSGRVMLRLFAVGAASSVVYRRVRFLSAAGRPVVLTPDAQPECFRGLPIVADFRGRWPDDASAYRWAIDHLMGGCDRGLAFSGGHSHDDTWLGGDPAITIGLDYPIARRAFCFNLSPVEGPWPHDGRTHPGYAGQAALFDEIMGRLNRPCGVFGWAEPEDRYCARVSTGGNFVLCAGAPNMSFWAKTPADGAVRLPIRKPATRQLRRKHYVIFQTNEGDTPKILAGLMGGAWTAPGRGAAPIAWGINPYLADLFPALFEYFAVTARPADTFFAGCSGAGYSYPWRMPNLPAYARHVARRLAAHGPRVVDIWENGMPMARYASFNAIVGAECLTQQTVGGAVNTWLDDGTPVLSADRRLYYYEPKGADPAGQVVKWVEEVAAAHEPPFFILCYGAVGPALPALAAEVRRRLPSDRFEVIGADAMAALARQAGALTLTVDGAGVAPGGVLSAEITVRGAGRPLPAGRVTFDLPPGWSAEPRVWRHGPVAARGVVRGRVALRAGPSEGRVRIACAGAADGIPRAVGVMVFAATERLADCSTREGWREAGASLTLADGALRVRTAGPFGAVRRSVEVDFDREPVLEIAVPASEGVWALKANDGSLEVDRVIQPETGETGRLTYDLAPLLRWTGRKRLDLILFAVGPGRAVDLRDMRVHYRR